MCTISVEYLVKQVVFHPQQLRKKVLLAKRSVNKLEFSILVHSIYSRHYSHLKIAFSIC